ncbi:MAG: hypothetical protein AB4426_12120 [Xenococcaceae cyanobacterium]
MSRKSQTSRKKTSPARKSPQTRTKKGEPLAEIKTKGHHYPVKVIKLSIEQIIISGHVIDVETLGELVFTVDVNQLKKIWSFSGKNHENAEELKSTLSRKLGQAISPENREAIIRAASLGQRRFDEKLGWLKEYKDSLIKWTKMLEITRNIESKLKREGLHKQSLPELEKFLTLDSIPANVANLCQKIRDYLFKQTAVIQDDTFFLATSDVLESLFGKYKFFSRRCPLQELGRMILTIPLATLNFTVDLIKQALETITSVDVKTWSDQLFGPSTLSKRKMVFSSLERIDRKSA